MALGNVIYHSKISGVNGIKEERMLVRPKHHEWYAHAETAKQNIARSKSFSIHGERLRPRFNLLTHGAKRAAERSTLTKEQIVVAWRLIIEMMADELARGKSGEISAMGTLGRIKRVIAKGPEKMYHRGRGEYFDPNYTHRIYLYLEVDDETQKRYRRVDYYSGMRLIDTPPDIGIEWDDPEPDALCSFL